MVAQGILGGFLLLSIFEAVSRSLCLVLPQPEILQDASWRLHCHILLLSSLHNGPVLHHSQVSVTSHLFNKRMKPFTFPLQGSLWFSTCLNSGNSADRGLFWKLSSSNLLTSGVDLVPAACPLSKPSAPLPQCLSQLFEVELDPALD